MNGDFGRNAGIVSHHIAGAADPTAAQCLICHNLGQHGSGTVRLNNADNGAVIAATSNVNVETFCLSCHDTDGANGTMGPFSDGRALGATYPVASVTRPPTTNEIAAIGWATPDNAHVDDGLYATASPGQSETIESRWGNFGFDAVLPSRIERGHFNYVRIIVQYHVDTQASIARLNAQATVGGADCPTTPRYDPGEPLADTIVTFDVTSCRNWSLSDLLDASFKVKLGASRGASATPVIFSLDYVQVEANYNGTSYVGSTLIKDAWNKTYGHRQKGLSCLGTGQPNTGCHGNAHGTGNAGVLARNLTFPQASGACYSIANENDYDLCFSCHASYPNVTKEAVLGMQQGGNYDTESYCNVSAGAYNIPNIMTKFRDACTWLDTQFYDECWFTGGHEQLHTYHVQITPAWLYRDSVDSGIVCNTCHNVHGSNTQNGMLFDELQYTHYDGVGVDKYGTMDAPNKFILGDYPLNCTFNCHSIVTDSYNWYEPADE